MTRQKNNQNQKQQQRVKVAHTPQIQSSTMYVRTHKYLENVRLYASQALYY